MSGAHPPLPEVVRGRQRAHQARAMRARIVARAQEYREACRQHEEVMVAVMKEPALPTEVVLETEQRLFDLLQEARAALFGALEELEQVEEEESRGGRRESGEDE